MSDLHDELDLLRAALARRLRERLDTEGPVPPSYLDVVRKFLLDQMPKNTARRAPPIVTGLPFPTDEDA